VPVRSENSDVPVTSDYASPLLEVPGAANAPAGHPDHGVPWHYGDPFGEQREAATGLAVVDRSHRKVLTVTGDERLTWLHTLTSQHLEVLPDATVAENLILDGNGRIEDHFVLTDLGGTAWIDTEPWRGAPLLDYLTKMVFWSKAEPVAADDYAVLTVLGPQLTDGALGELFTLPAVGEAAALPGGGLVRRMPWPTADTVDLIVPRAELRDWWDRITAHARPAGSWAFEALRVESLRPRLGVDTDERTIPHETGWIGGYDIGGAVHLDKGCYRGQETVARVHNLGKPPRHLVLIHLDGSTDARPETGAELLSGGRAVGRIGTVVDHHELGPVALALVRRALKADAELEVGENVASIDPDSMPRYDEPQAGRQAIDRLRGR